MRLYKRMALGAVVFGVIGPIVVAACIATLAAITKPIGDYEGLGELVGSWCAVFAVGSLIAFYAGWAPAALVGVFVGALATRIRWRYFYPLSILGAPIVVISFWKSFDNSSGDELIAVSGGGSIAATAVLSPLLLAIIRRSQNATFQREHGSEKRATPG